MGLRQILNEKPWVGALVGVAGIAGLVLSVWLSTGPRDIPPDRVAFFTSDEGKTWFKDDAGRVPPFDHQGKPAYRAFVFECGGKEFVAYMQRYGQAEKKGWEEKLKAAAADGREMEARVGLARGGEFKRPGDKDWISGQTNPMAVGKMQTVTCEDGSPAEYVAP
jgi:hypothetical protein